MVDVKIINSNGHATGAKVSEFGQLVVAPLQFDQSKFIELGEINVAFNFFPPITGKFFVITGFLAYGDKQIGTVDDATVIIYEGNSSTTATVDKILYQFQIAKSMSIPMPSQNTMVSEGKFVNAKTDDNDVHMTITGYYVDVP